MLVIRMQPMALINPNFPTSRPSGVPNGMMLTMQTLRAILLSAHVVSPGEFCQVRHTPPFSSFKAIDKGTTQVPALLRRMRHLIRVYYDALTSGNKTAEFRYCDYSSIHAVGCDLHEMGLILLHTPGRLRTMLECAPDMDAFLLDEPIDLGDLRLSAFVRQELSETDPDPVYDEERESTDLEQDVAASSDLAAYQMVYFIADVLVGWLLVSHADDSEAGRKRTERAFHMLVEYSTSPIYRRTDAFGDALTCAMEPVYRTPWLLREFIRAGGLPAIFDDWVCCQQLCRVRPADNERRQLASRGMAT